MVKHSFLNLPVATLRFYDPKKHDLGLALGLGWSGVLLNF